MISFRLIINLFSDSAAYKTVTIPISYGSKLIMTPLISTWILISFDKMALLNIQTLLIKEFVRKSVIMIWYLWLRWRYNFHRRDILNTSSSTHKDTVFNVTDLTFIYLDKFPTIKKGWKYIHILWQMSTIMSHISSNTGFLGTAF